MALLPTPKAKMDRGYPGMWANMEECNSFTAFAGSALAYGVPVQNGAGDMDVVPLATGGRFIGISLSNAYTSGTPVNGEERYGVGDKLGVADEGVIYVRAGGAVTKGALPFFLPSDGKYYTAAGAGRLPLPNAEFDESAADGEVVALRVRIAPGGANVTAGS